MASSVAGAFEDTFSVARTCLHFMHRHLADQQRLRWQAGDNGLMGSVRRRVNAAVNADVLLISTQLGVDLKSIDAFVPRSLS